MNLEETIKKWFTQDNLIEFLTKYELYYQISLGNYIFETMQDIDESYKKIEELALEVNPNHSLGNIFDIILHFSHQEDFENKFEYYLRSRALFHSLQDFIDFDKELINKEAYLEQKSKMILEDTFFNQNMKLQLESEYGLLSEHYELMVTPDIVKKIQSNYKNGIFYE